jgi:hypothetical protein
MTPSRVGVKLESHSLAGWQDAGLGAGPRLGRVPGSTASGTRVPSSCGGGPPGPQPYQVTHWQAEYGPLAGHSVPLSGSLPAVGPVAPGRDCHWYDPGSRGPVMLLASVPDPIVEGQPEGVATQKSAEATFRT